MFKNFIFVLLVFLFFVIQSCTPDALVEDIEKDDRIELETIELREFADTENDTIGDTEGGEGVPDDGRD